MLVLGFSTMNVSETVVNLKGIFVPKMKYSLEAREIHQDLLLLIRQFHTFAVSTPTAALYIFL